MYWEPNGAEHDRGYRGVNAAMLAPEEIADVPFAGSTAPTPGRTSTEPFGTPFTAC